jgi:hypothetical protein
VDRHRFDSDPEPNFLGDADPDPDPDWRQNDADPRADPAPSFQKYLVQHTVPVLKFSGKKFM